jgi:hypothetical protein
VSRWDEVKDVADAGYSREIRGENFSEPNGLPEAVQDCMPAETVCELRLRLNSEDALSGWTVRELCGLHTNLVHWNRRNHSASPRFLYYQECKRNKIKRVKSLPRKAQHSS